MADTDYDDDLSFAYNLQAEFDLEAAVELSKSPNKPPTKATPSSTKKQGTLNKIKDLDKYNVVDPVWELIDPTPDIHALFVHFNKIYFWSELNVCEVKWSAQLTSSAGNCGYDRRVGSCLIKLSSPLLRLRPRKDLVETLLHEMIHAYLFITKNNRDHGAHGPEFVKHMDRLNRQTGAHISIYHSFHDEVDLYRVHWWQCNGPCKERRPFFGLVKSARNRAPGPSYVWWDTHQASCPGIFIKIRGPEIKVSPSKTSSASQVIPKVFTTPSKKAKSTPRKGTMPTSTFVPFSSQGHLLGGSAKGAIPKSTSERLTSIENRFWQGFKIGTPISAKPNAGSFKATAKSNSPTENYVRPGLKNKLSKTANPKATTTNPSGHTQPKLDKFLVSPKKRVPPTVFKGFPNTPLGGVTPATITPYKSAITGKMFSSAKHEAVYNFIMNDSSDDDGPQSPRHKLKSKSLKRPSPSDSPRRTADDKDRAKRPTITGKPSSSKHLLFTVSDLSSDEEEPISATVNKNRSKNPSVDNKFESPSKRYSAIVLSDDDDDLLRSVAVKNRSIIDIPKPKSDENHTGQYFSTSKPNIATESSKLSVAAGGSSSPLQYGQPRRRIAHTPSVAYSASRRKFSPAYLVIDGSDDEIIPPSPEVKRALVFGDMIGRNKADQHTTSNRKKPEPNKNLVTANTVTYTGNAGLTADQDLSECPVCGIRLPMLIINDHLDVCLAS